MLRRKFIKLFLYFLGLFLIALSLWTEKYFGKITVDQALSTIMFNTQGAIDANSSFLKRFMEWCVYWPLAVTFTIAILPVFCRTAAKLLRDYRLGRLIKNIFSVHLSKLLILIGVLLVGHQYSLFDYAKEHLHRGKDYFATHYINPDKVKIASKHTKSLVLVYVESLETTYENTRLFRNNLLQRLTRLNANHTEFTRYQQMPGTSWSVAGIIATQCAVPLKLITMFPNNDFGENVKQFLPGAKCLGDILYEKGYKNVYLNGSALSFAGVGKFFKDHHYTELYGRDEWLKNGVVKREQLTSWGLPDDMLLAQARIKLAALIKENKPFNLTIFTIDTHGLSGQLSKSCAAAGYNTFEGIVECTSNQVAKFVDDIKKNGWLDKVDVVVIGDHLAMRNLAYKELESADKRYIFNSFITKKPLIKNTDDIVPFDMLPTILTTLGFQIDGGRLGLGYSAFGGKYTPRSLKSIADLKVKLPRYSEAYNRLWF